MKGLKIIPLFAMLMALAYLGVYFVEANRDPVTLAFGHHQSPPTALGFVVLTSVLFGMCLSGALCSFELLLMIVENRRLKRKLTLMKPPASPPTDRLAEPLPADDR